jgi:hypothetical protein
MKIIEKQIPDSLDYNYIALSGLGVSWLCHSIGLRPILWYDTPSGLLN